MVIYLFICWAFCLFSFNDREVLLFTLFIVCSFDAFSQLSGQLFGRWKLCPRISPNKTIEGLIGGFVISLIISVVIGSVMTGSTIHFLFMGSCITISSFLGDLSASYVKRLYNVKNFSSAIPEHGGFLDRFDSLILAGAVVHLIENMNIWV
ncbi:MAG: phosphatidate cytidylyltransferase [Flavobacteriaceae bacterium]|jgi:phosphatidate cytidylyltransferase|nr:phosphatidate cytidylyltransferase [Flavobacteriaceae bacterium]